MRGVLLFVSVLACSGAALAVPPERAAVASAHPLASQAGIDILDRGGNAFDAAVAVSAALGVVEPYSSGLGGGGFFLLRRADGLEVMIDGRETAPGAAGRDMYLGTDGEPIAGASTEGPLAAGIPGLPAALVHVAERYGALPLAESLAPAIRYAEAGFPVDSELIERLERKAAGIGRWPAAPRIFLPAGRPPFEGSLLRQPDLARTLEALAEQGRDGFYRGRVARRLVQGVRAAGGIWALEDLAAYRVVEREPVRGEYRGHRIVSAAPPSSGGVGLVNMLNILAGFSLPALETPTREHVVVEAMRRAYRDRAEYLGDPDFVDMPLARLLHLFYAAGQRTSLRLDRATPSAGLPGVLPSGAGDDTSHFSVLDREGNAVAVTQSINFSFGSLFMPPGTGVWLNNEMDDFSIKPGVPNGFLLLGAEANAIAPGKRMLSSMTPTLVMNDQRLAILGTPGGSRIISMVLLATLAWADGADAEAMVSLPRFHHQYFPDRVSHEPDAFTPAQIAALEQLGHTVNEIDRRYGNMHVVTWDRASGAVDAASDPRGGGEPRFGPAAPAAARSDVAAGVDYRWQAAQ